MEANEVIDHMVKLSDEDILKLRKYCDKELKHRLYWIRKWLKEFKNEYIQIYYCRKKRR